MQLDNPHLMSHNSLIRLYDLHHSLKTQSISTLTSLHANSIEGVQDSVDCHETRMAESMLQVPNKQEGTRQLASNLVAFDKLPQFFSDKFEPKAWTAYKEIIYSLVKQGPRRPDVRKTGHRKLRKLLTEHKEAAHAHNTFARDYNSDFTGKHVRFHLPIYPDLDQQDGEEHSQQTVSEEEISEQVSHRAQESRLTTHTDLAAVSCLAINRTHPRGSSSNNILHRISAPAQSARAYLEWLRYRGATFPSVVPMLADAKMLAPRLGQTAASIYDDITHHYLLETDGVKGLWYRNNRLEVLGEDPKLD